jgi:LuxR family maltose regulon positive regulatory protein
MGYGKTMAIREYAKQFPGKVVWVAAFGRAPEVFWRSLAKELAKVRPELAKPAQALAKLGFPHDHVLAGMAVEILENLTDAAGPILLVFDDCHLLPTSFSAFVDSLAVASQANLRIVCVSRHAWPGQLEILKLKGFLAIIDRESLAFEAVEILEYYRLCGLAIDLKTAEEMRQTTNGWISALYLGLLRYRRDGLLSPPADIQLLLEKEIFETLSPQAQDLLITLAPLKYFSAKQAQSVYGDTAETFLSEALNKNAFIFFDHDNLIYIIHNIFQKLIMEKFNAWPLQKRQDIFRAQAQWFLAHGEMIPAMEALAQAADYELALASLEKDMANNLVTENAHFFSEMFKACPVAVLERHLGAAFKLAIALFSVSDFAAYAAQCSWLASRCEVMETGGEADRWRGELELLRSLLAFNDIEAMSVHHRKANELLRGPTSLFRSESPWALGCPSVLFMFHRESGQLEAEVKQMRECLPHYYKLASHNGAGGEYLLEAEALYYSGRWLESTAACGLAETMASRYGQLGNVLCAKFVRSRLALAQVGLNPPADLERALDLASAMKSLINRSQDYFLLHTVELCEGWLRASVGQIDKIPAWLRHGETESVRLYSFAKGYYYIVHGLALLLRQKYVETYSLFNFLINEGFFAKNLLFLIYARVYLAGAHLGLGQNEEAERSLKIALEVAWPDNIYMPFVENFELIKPLLSTIDFNGLEKIWALGERRQAGLVRAKRILGQAEADPFGLTEREKEIMKLAAEGLTCQEMAESLLVTNNTIKSHLKAGYRKCGVKNRTGLRKLYSSRSKDSPD